MNRQAGRLMYMHLTHSLTHSLTGMEAGLLTTTMSSSMWMIRIFSDVTGTSCLKQISVHIFDT